MSYNNIGPGTREFLTGGPTIRILCKMFLTPSVCAVSGFEEYFENITLTSKITQYNPYKLRGKYTCSSTSCQCVYGTCTLKRFGVNQRLIHSLISLCSRAILLFRGSCNKTAQKKNEPGTVTQKKVSLLSCAREEVGYHEHNVRLIHVYAKC